MLEAIDYMLNSMGTFNCANTLDQVMGCCDMQTQKEDQTHLGIVTPWNACVCSTLLQGVNIVVDFY